MTGLRLHVTATDGLAESDDAIGITLWDGNKLLFSSNWSGGDTAEQRLSAGDDQGRPRLDAKSAGAPVAAGAPVSFQRTTRPQELAVATIGTPPVLSAVWRSVTQSRVPTRRPAPDADAEHHRPLGGRVAREDEAPAALRAREQQAARQAAGA